MSRPEHTAPPELFYNETEARKYAQSSRMQQIQSVISERALELLKLPPGPKLLLDVGCGTGMSGETLENHGHTWVGMDISKDMLNVGAERLQDEEEGSTGDFVERDMGQGVGFRGGVFDGAISISAVQWLCYANSKTQIPRLRLKKFFQQLYHSLTRGGRAVIQLYPETPQQMEMITNAAMGCGFTGGLVVDYPNSAKAKKYYLVLMSGVPSGASSDAQQLPSGLGTLSKEEADFERRRQKYKKKRANGRASVKSREWIQNKKDRQRRQGKEVKTDSKYSGRRRNKKF